MWEASVWKGAFCDEKSLYVAEPLHSLAFGEEVGDFRWKDKRTPVVALYKLHDDFGRLLGKILVEKVASSRKYL